MTTSTTQHKYNGITFLDMQGNKMTVTEFSERFNAYLAQREGSNPNFREILNVSDIEFYLSKQEKIIASMEKNAQREKEEEEKERAAREEYEHDYGFTDNMTDLQKGRVLKTLNRQVRYEGKVMTRKDFILLVVRKGYKPVILDKVLTSTKKINLERIEHYKYNVPAMKNSNGDFFTVTKTEYNYASYLIDMMNQ